MMRLRRHSRRQRVKAEMNVVPYIDVMLVLLVIFMIAAPLINQSVNVDLPFAPGEKLKMPESVPDDMPPVVLTIDEQGLYYLNYYHANEAILMADVVAIIQELRQQYPQLPVIVRGDKYLPYNDIFTAVLALKQEGVSNVGMATTTAGL